MPILRSSPSYVTLGTDTSLLTERVATGGAGVSLTDGGEGGNLKFDFDYIDLPRKRTGFIDDFFGDPYTAASYTFVSVAAGTGASSISLDVTETGIFGAWNLPTGTTTTGYTSIRNGLQYQNFRIGQGVMTMEAKIKIPILSDGTDRFKTIFGVSDVWNTSTVVDGIYFEYTDSASTNWRYCTSNDSSRTENNSSTAVGTGWTKLKIVINADATLVEYFVDDVSIGTINSNIPTADGDELIYGYGIFKSSLGTNNRSAYIDYFASQTNLTTQR